jgi:D-arabinose 1-dehydrogenase-like Zn-dependent alcohol dehydrogenase
MRTRILYTDGKGKFTETGWNKPDPTADEIEVKAVMTGVCRSDIDMMTGGFGPLPLEMSGHEGLGKVTRVGANVLDIRVGDLVSTRGEPAYSDYYNVRQGEYVSVPEAHPRYIIEPVACGYNLIMQTYDELLARHGDGSRLLILGSGFLAWVAYNALIIEGLRFDIDVVGSSNTAVWEDRLQDNPKGQYDVIIDLSDKTDVFDSDILNLGALVIMGTQKQVTTDFSRLLWKACTMVFPSPRNPRFHLVMARAEFWVSKGNLDVDYFWTQAYNRDSEWQQAFDDGLNRPVNYSRGYIVWQDNK